jgi:tRNA dimethylallyltransferase
VPEEARGAVEALWREGGEAAVRARLRAGDAASEGRIAAGDRQRLVRALSVLEATGTPLGDWQGRTDPLLPPGAWRGVVVEPDRPALYARCDARLAAMVQGGALSEVSALMARGLDPDLPALKALGVREFARHLNGEIALDAALAEAQQATRNYAKRQLTWFRNQTPDWPRIAALDPVAAWAEFASGQGLDLRS